MSGATDTEQWTSVDCWWDKYTETEPVTYVTPTATALDAESTQAIPRNIDLWWDSYSDLDLVQTPYADTVDDLSIDDSWTDLEKWWDIYSKTQADDIAEIVRLLTESNTLWQRQAGPFDADPLSVDLDQSARGGHPLNPVREEEWSDWLAQLLRTDSGEFHRELFGEAFDTSPQQIEREAYFPSPHGKDRYADILSLHTADGISIEVKIGDTNLQKTTDTTALIEDQHYRDWRHYLLLPEQDLWVVREQFDIDVTAADDEREMIPSEESEDIAIIHWLDVSHALRTVLLGENGQTQHWSASAYLLCAQVEQEQLGFTPKPIIDQIGAEAGTVQPFHSLSVVIEDIEAQTEYLQTFIETTNE